MIQSVQRATDILSLFSPSQPTLGVTQMAALLGLNKATTWGLVTTLEHQRFLQQDSETQKYSLGPKLFELGMVYLGALDVNTKSSRLLHALSSRTGLNSRLGIWDRGTVLVSLLALPKAEDSFSHQIGPRVPAYCSGLGKALLAYLPPEELEDYLQHTELVRHGRNTIVAVETLRADLAETKLRGYAVSQEEMIPGLVAFGAPIFDRRQAVAGAISLSGPPSVLLGKNRESLAEELLRTAAEISQEMGYYIDLGGPQKLARR